MKQGKRANGALFSFVSLPSAHRGATVIVSKKVAKSAVDRNRLKRKSYAALRAIVPSMSVPASLVCIARVALLTASVADIEKELTLHFVKKKV